MTRRCGASYSQCLFAIYNTLQDASTQIMSGQQLHFQTTIFETNKPILPASFHQYLAVAVQNNVNYHNNKVLPAGVTR